MEVVHKIRPSARILSTIGADLIKDMNAAVLELVKNAYDADANNVIINIKAITDETNSDEKIKIVISDDGHGMCHDTVVNKWLVPATEDKLKRKYSPKGRMLQGKKGIGRYAVAILGEQLNLKTIDVNGQETRLDIDWSEIDQHKYLEDINVHVETSYTVLPSGTMLEITGSKDKLYEWSKLEVESLLYELRKMISPIKKEDRLKLKDSIKEQVDFESKEDDRFDVIVKFEDFIAEDYENEEIIIEPIELIDLYDYRLFGTVSNDGNCKLVFVDNIGQSKQSEVINRTIFIPYDQRCGDLQIDIRVYDRDPESIENIISRGLIDPYTGRYYGKRDARTLLDKMSGIAIYRGDFRIRPYGDAGYDWLELDKKRVQTPSKRIGSNQVIGFVQIESEEKSNLLEKSARDGLKEDMHYLSLKNILIETIHELETRRYIIRKNTGRGRTNIGIQKDLNNLFDFNQLNIKIENILEAAKLESKHIVKVKEVIAEIEKEKSEELKRIEEKIAIYHGQATLGKILMVVLHEGRKPLSWFKNQARTLSATIEQIIKSPNEGLLIELKDRVLRSKSQAEKLSKLFKRLQPLASNRRAQKKLFSIKEVIQESYEVFEEQLVDANIKFEICGQENAVYNGWKEDFNIIFTNLIENSLYWLKTIDKSDKEIIVNVVFEGRLEYIDYRDNGPGIKKEYIENEIIFEPDFSTKLEGTGLGLALAGEASERNSLRLKAVYNGSGAYFRLTANDVEGECNDQ